MNKILTFVFFLAGLHMMGQSIKLEWKIGEGEELNYSTIMSQNVNSNDHMKHVNMDSPIRDSSVTQISVFNEMFADLNNATKNTAMLSTLTNRGNGIIDVVIKTSPNEKPNNSETEKNDSAAKEIYDLVGQLNDGVIMRGAVYATGGIQSFWVNNNQKGILSTFFELPHDSVKIGDTWTLDVHLLEIDQNFRCDSSNHINEVTLTDIRKENGETIATIKYNIVEYVEGKMNFPVFIYDGIEHKATKYYSFKAIAEFSVDRGRWISYEGISTFDQDDMMNFNYQMRYALICK